MRLLLGSGGFTTPERRDRWIQVLDDFLGPVEKVLFVPYALADHDDYVARMTELNFQAGRELLGIHTCPDPIRAVEQADAVYVGGGNSFRLLADLFRARLHDIVRERVRAGMPYIGVSAGTNAACPTIKTTNDMPITWPPSLEAFDLIRFQINPHYFAGPTYIDMGEGKYIPYGGETRDVRLREFHEMNDTPIVALWEGEILRIEGSDYRLTGLGGARVFLKGQEPVDLAENAALPRELAAE